MTEEEKLEKETEELFSKKPLGYAMNPELEIYADGFKEGYNKAMKEWRDCFMSCSSPYCADKFRDIQCGGMLGNMTKEVRDESNREKGI